jgi:hypothetical protein
MAYEKSEGRGAKQAWGGNANKLQSTLSSVVGYLLNCLPNASPFIRRGERSGPLGAIAKSKTRG